MTDESLKKEYISCAMCGSKVHSISAHLKDFHPDVTISDYQRLYPDSPILSAWGKLKVAEFQKRIEEKAKVEAQRAEAQKTEAKADDNCHKETISKVFNLPAGICKNKLGEEISISVLNDSDNPKSKSLVPEISDNYIYDIKELKFQLMALELNTPCLVWGHKGCGKTEGIEQICARTNRSFMRIQHTANTEEAHIVGQWIVKNGETVYQLGALSEAMNRLKYELSILQKMGFSGYFLLVQDIVQLASETTRHLEDGRYSLISLETMSGSFERNKHSELVGTLMVMGYHRPVSSYNIGKQGEFEERKYFKETKCHLDEEESK